MSFLGFLNDKIISWDWKVERLAFAFDVQTPAFGVWMLAFSIYEIDSTENSSKSFNFKSLKQSITFQFHFKFWRKNWQKFFHWTWRARADSSRAGLKLGSGLSNLKMTLQGFQFETDDTIDFWTICSPENEFSLGMAWGAMTRACSSKLSSSSTFWNSRLAYEFFRMAAPAANPIAEPPLFVNCIDLLA